MPHNADRATGPGCGWGGIRLVLTTLAIAALGAAGCSTAGPGSAGADQRSAPAQCTHTIIHSDDVEAALEGASPGDTVCFSGSDLVGADLTMTRSGTAQAPITLAADGTAVREIQVKADHVVLRGFTVTGGSGVLLEGTGLIARNNSVHDTQRGGITCQDCTDSTIEFNTMTRAASNGISISGQRITVHANTISQTVPVHNGDADGMRFFGNGHRITDNTVSDISAEDYDNPPHPDCFQTLDDGKPPTFDVVISGNTCRNVDAQCLIATGDQGGNSGAPAGVASIVFENNTCANNGAQAVNLRGWPDVQVLRNTFSGPNLTRAVLIAEGSTSCTVTGNTTTRGRPTVEVDESQPGSQVSGDRPS